ncbi:MAG: MBOAT family protein [Anaerolineales bacterium]|nr:MBOAT family protein [Anaerolineales bacterium]
MAFYGFWRIEFVPVMLLSTIVDYFVSLQIPKAKQKNKKKLLYASLFINFGLLFYFKYLIFFSENAIGLANLLGADLRPLTLNIILPLGISFYTFQTVSYTIDVYREHIKPEKDFILYACYVTFFPQLVAGPILRAAEVTDQLAHRPPFTLDNIALGLRRIIQGLFLKVVLADNIAPLVDAGFAMPVATMSALDVWTLAFLFGFQIYFDFSAYSHIAIGSAKLMGINFPENFDFPYLATSPRDFWRRWHISLSSWIRDYLYLPLAGVKVREHSVHGLSGAVQDNQKTKALFMTWAIMGLWHGANWTFLLWGIYHALVVYIYRLVKPSSHKLNTYISNVGGVIITLPVIMLAWVPFRAESLTATVGMWSKVVNPLAYTSLNMRENVYLVTAIILVGLFAAKWIQSLFKPSNTLTFFGETVAYAVMIPLIIVFLRPIAQFIYFQF